VTLGLDIGGASIKAASSTGWTRSVRFPLWQSPELLSGTLRTLCQATIFDRIVLTMTGELCDAFETKEEGVRRILSSAVEAFGSRTPLHIWQTTGQFCDAKQACDSPWETGAANWLALATYAGARTQSGRAILIDIGSTTTDIIPIKDGIPIPRGRTDPERLASRELVYHGVRRTPVSSILQRITLDGIDFPLMRELFATSLDAYLLSGEIVENSNDSDTADHRPETIPFAIDRLARMIGSDRTRFTKANAEFFAQAVRQSQLDDLKEGILAVKRTASFDSIDVVIISGEGEFLARRLLGETKGLQAAKVISLAELLTPATSRAACAYAVAMLAEQTLGK